MSDQLRYAFRLFFTLTWTTFKMRYYGSILGYVWSLLRPLALFGVLYVVFTFVLKVDTPHYKLFLLLGIILWTFFGEATTLGMNGFISNYMLVRKVYLPRVILVASAVSSAFVGLFFNLIVFTIFAIVDGVDWSLKMLWFFPILLALYMLVLGIGLILSILVVKVRDTINLWEVAVQLGFWLTPVMYPMSNVPEKFRFLVFLNPMSGVLEYSRYYLVGIGSVTNIGYLYVVGISVLLLGAGICVFKWKEGEMVEDL